MSDQLKTATAAAHQSLEAFLIPIIKQTRTPAEYGKLLRMFYGYYKPLEDAIDRFPVGGVLADFELRRKAALILQDMKDLTAEPLPVMSAAVPAISNLPQAMGALYVLEGSTLGGQIIAKILQRNLHRGPETGFRFFSGYGEETAAKWECFQEVLAGFCADRSQYPEVEKAAEQTFIHLKSWAETCYRYEHTKEKL